MIDHFVEKGTQDNCWLLPRLW